MDLLSGCVRLIAIESNWWAKESKEWFYAVFGSVSVASLAAVKRRILPTILNCYSIFYNRARVLVLKTGKNQARIVIINALTICQVDRNHLLDG
jgi:hypothetical protein